MKREDKRHTFRFKTKTLQFLRMINFLDTKNQTRKHQGETTKKSFNDWVDTVIQQAAMREIGLSRDEQVLAALEDNLRSVNLEMEILHDMKMGIRAQIIRRKRLMREIVADEQQKKGVEQC